MTSLKEEFKADFFTILGNEAPTIERIKFALAVALNDYELSKAEHALEVYEGDPNEIIIKKFIIAKKVSGCTDRTLNHYMKQLQFTFGKLQKPCLAVSADDLTYYFALRLMNDGVTKTTVKNEQRVLSSFFTWLRVHEYRTDNPIEKIDQIKLSKTKKEAFSDKELEDIRYACRTPREVAIIEVLLSTGCRVSELVSLKHKEISDGKCKIIGKGEKERIVYLNAKAMKAIEIYMDERKDSNPYLFPRTNANGFNNANSSKYKDKFWYRDKSLVHDSEPMDKCSIESIVRGIGRRAGVEKCHPHKFRRTCATFSLRRGMPIEQVSKMLGHESIETTQIYLDLNEKDLEAAHRRYVI